MFILGIDTSCDDTSAAVLSEHHQVLSNVIHSQVKLHQPHGGVVPELASREHIRNIMPVVQMALDTAGLKTKEISAVAVTVGPGLIGSLLVGLYYAKGLAFGLKIPLVAVNHLEGHILSIFLEEQHPSFPFVVLTVSGGHTNIYHVRGWGEYQLLGQTLDDAAGEAFDKVSKILGLGYPGGPVLERAARGGEADKIKFPRAYLSKGSLDFSFSGLKTAVALYIKEWEKDGGNTSGVTLEDIAAAFQEAVVDVLVDKLILAAQKCGVKEVCMAGGVACNNHLRERLSQAATEHGLRAYWPRPAFCTDNGAMIGLAGYYKLKRGETADLSIDVQSRFPIG